MRNSILTIILSICSLYAWAQNTGESGVNPVGSLQVDISRVISVQNAKKLSVPIQIEKIRVADPSYDYPIFPKLFAVNPYYSEPIQPITLGEVKMPQLLKNYAVAGFGNYRNALADFYFSSNRDRSKVYDIAFNHRSGKAPSRYSGFGTTNLKANMERLYQKHQLNLSLNGYYKTLHHYGFFSDSIPDSININADSIKTNYGNVDLQLRYNNFRSNTEKHKYEAWLLPYYFRSNHGETEWAAVGGAHLIENLNKTSLLNFEVQYDYNTYYVASGNWLRNIVRVGANYE
ncbi:hypothetical protein GC194_09665, partial [bacterium]|nr:hypothetical protein [bacterium]